ncbi:prolyl-tRNA synthetase associated domain-containing protein [Anaerococcus vaginalis]|uniref:prolyl-tRNA synthetase associated domain-containing protein n=1 Tax=Anaerococcus vaginalis TaxID=33037 RepID=UPI002906AAC3|nr:prolyl-tRNA synthetase associated domain-containing protein [Anaerococcus vaginalis]MDU4447722.1 prolyl-tRNA synthetase associated domain-containing protein [Anaerococcus vaginalis]MDU5085884.1 prolyl-tRNA synthetase associated domain-containing protein [Anaerococcus vaginalis]MDU5559662.1 prolyl-tRNA synthetase associated domain-containing protein [Anaerococcus vaginalis]MDU6182548.1 prolyl-tRNA synthetase associated domain-containing protein [Anaerococcus vaginalis]MDU7432957.1 prolyl-tRN
MDQYKMVENKLNELEIDFKIVDHPPAFTTEEADKYIEGHDGVRTKSMFLTDRKKKNFYLVILDDYKRLDMDRFKDIVGEKKVKMASENSLMEKMKLPAGTVSPFGLLNNEDHDIKFFMDKEIVDEEIMTFHPNINEKTLFLKTKDLFKYLDNIGYEVNIIEL